MTFFKFFFLVALLNGVVLIVALLTRKENRLANLLLSGMIAAGLYGQFVRYLVISGDITHLPYLVYSGFPTSLLVPAFLYLYILALTIPDFRWESRLSFHFLPFLIGLAAYGGLFFFGPDLVVGSQRQPALVARYFLMALSIIVSGAYLIAGFYRLYSYRTLIFQYFSEVRHVRLRWLRWLLLLLMIPWGIGLLEVATGPYLAVEQWMIPAVTVVILLIGFYGLRQSVIFSSEEKWGSPLSMRKTRETASQIFTQEELAEWKNRLEEFILKEKPYLNAELRLFDLSKGLRLKSYQVSEILNRGLGTTFYDYINHFRIDEVKRRLSDPQYSALSLLGIAMDCGFNSKSVFNETFRKYTGMTPSAFRKTEPAP